MRARLDRLSLPFLGLALLAVVAFVASYWWHGEWVVYRSATGHVRLLSSSGREPLDQPWPGSRAWRSLASSSDTSIA